MHCPRSSLPVAQHTIGWAFRPGDVDPSLCPGERERERCRLDAMDWAHLAVEEGNIAQIGETLLIAAEAAQRSKAYMDTLMSWLRTKFEDQSGSPVKRQRTLERASGSHQPPVYEPSRPAHHPRAHADEPAPLQRRPRAPPLHDPGLPEGHPPPQDLRPQFADPHGRPGEATPYAVLRAQELLKKALPFLEQELAVIVSEAYANLEVWTSAIWGHSIQLVDSQSGEAGQVGETSPTQLEASLMEEGTNGGTTPASQAETVMMPLERERGRPPGTTRQRLQERQPSHRRRRLQAALANSSEDASESD